MELLLIKLNSLAFSFPEVKTASFLFLICPVTNITAERSFPQLKQIENYLRASMGQEQLPDLSLLYVDADILERLNFQL